uniref:Uncharacterized protein n=1 Tax=Oryza meridionalis TaxID=40149 RepID=A0A0E0DCN8_9ORYZ
MATAARCHGWAAAGRRSALHGGGLSISLAGPHGQIVGGAVVDPLITATTIVVVATAFTSRKFQRLPVEDDDAPASAFSSGADADEHRGLKVALQCRGRRSGRRGGWGKASAAATEAVGMEEPERHRAKDEVGRRLEG